MPNKGSVNAGGILPSGLCLT